MPDWLRFYHDIPYFLKVAAASAKGFQLYRQRYTKDTDQQVAEALSRETWTSAQWRSRQDEKLGIMLHHAATQIPYYRDYWNGQRRQGSKASWELLENWPVLTKDVLRDQPRSFIADHVDPSKLIVEHTSGTSGKPLTLWMSKEAVRAWYALFEARWRGWYGLSRFDRWGILGGQLVTSYSRQNPPFWVWNSGMRQLYLSSYHLAPQNIPAYLDAIQRHRLVYLLGYASSLYTLARYAMEKNAQHYPLKAIISNAEPLYAHQKEVISKAFQCPVYDTYGLSENVCAASECLQGRFHLWPEVGVTEVFDDLEDIPTPQGQTGRLICTGLLNLSMPLVRYEVSDRGYLSMEDPCACGRQMPILGGIEGRNDDVIITRAGRRIGRLDPVFKADMPIREAQIIQEDLDHVIVRYVPAQGCTENDLSSLITRLQQRLGDMKIALECVENIPRASNGKFKAVVSKIKLV